MELACRLATHSPQNFKTATTNAVGCWLELLRPLLHPVGTHDLCIRCVKGYSVVVLTGTDAQIVRPYRTQSRLVSSRRASVASVDLWLLAVGVDQSYRSTRIPS